MGNKNNAPPPESQRLTDFHRQTSKIFSETTTDQNLTLDDLLQIFPKRTLFCSNFLKWMQILSYKKTANKESFVFACEILSLDGEKVISTPYQNHSFLFLDVFFHMSVQKLPKDVVRVTAEELTNFADTLANFFFGDASQVPDLGQKFADVLFLQTSIAQDPVPYSMFAK